MDLTCTDGGSIENYVAKSIITYSDMIITDPVITITDDTWTARLCLLAIIAVYKIIIAAAAANIKSKKQFLSDLDWNQEEVAKEIQVKPKSMMRIGRNINLPPPPPPPFF